MQDQPLASDGDFVATGLFNPRSRALIVVSLVIILLTLFFLFLLVRNQQKTLADIIQKEQYNQQTQMELLQGQVGSSYRTRLKSFIANRKQVISAFAQGDRERLLQLSKPIYQLLKKENPYFSSLFFVGQDNRAFLRVQKPEIYGDDLTQLSPLVVAGNHSKKLVAGFEVVKKGLHYRIVAPVIVDGKHIGLVGFGISADYFLAQLKKAGRGHGHEHEPDQDGTDIALFFPQDELSKATFMGKPDNLVSDYAVFYHGQTHFKEFFSHGDYSLETLRGGMLVHLHGTTHALIRGVGFQDFKGREVAGVLALVNVGELVAGTKQTILQTVALAVGLLLVAILVLYFSFGLLFRQISKLTESLSLANHDLEQRVEERTEELQQSEENLRITLDSIGDAVIATDTLGQVVRMNPMAEKLTGWSREDAEGQPLEEVFHIIGEESRQPLASPVERILASGDIAVLDPGTLLLTRNGKELKIADSGAPIYNSSGGTIGVVLVFRDVTEEQAIQEQLRQSQKMEAVGLLAGGVAHDFNNMLGGILGAAELLARHLPDDPKSEKFLHMITDSAERAAELTANLLSFARKQPISSTPIDVHVALRNTVSLLKNTLDRRVEIDVDLAAEASVVVGDLSQLQNAFLNLGINASQAMPEGGRLSVVTRVISLDEAYCEMSSFELTPGPYLEIEFQDTGCGIEKSNLGQIFDPFFTTKSSGKGTGLGLASVLGTLQQHKGAVNVYTELGEGTAFHLFLPLVKQEAFHLNTATELVPGKGRILIVDDEAVMRATAGAILESLGYEILVAEDGRRGLALFEQRWQEIDLVLMDMIMPEMNGRDCFAEMRKIDPSVRVLLSSGFTRVDDLNDLRAAGLMGFIRKPYYSSALSRVVAAALNTDPSHGDLWGGAEK